MRLSLAAAITGLAALVSSVTAAENTTSLPDCLSVPVNVTWTRPYQGEKWIPNTIEEIDFHTRSPKCATFDGALAIFNHNTSLLAQPVTISTQSYTLGGNDVNMTRYDKYNVSGLPLGTGYYVALIVAGNSSAIIGTLSADFEIVQNLTQQSGATNRLPWAASTLMAVGVATFLAI